MGVDGAAPNSDTFLAGVGGDGVGGIGGTGGDGDMKGDTGVYGAATDEPDGAGE